MDSYYSGRMAITGVSVLVTNSTFDSRGTFTKTFAKQREPQIQDFRVAETFYSTTYEGSARGMHLQVGLAASNRIISCLHGRIFDVLIDLRKNSDTFLQTETLTLSPDEMTSIYVPAGVAHGFIALEKSITHYLSDNSHQPELDKGIHMESLGIKYPVSGFTLSQRDKSLPTLIDWLKNDK